MSSSRRALLGVLVNPIAGMGGRVALKGTDGPEALAEARRRGAVPVAPERARKALASLKATVDPHVLAGPGEMGCDIAASLGIDVEATGPVPPRETEPDDTRAAARAMLEAGVDLLLFAGGDGTARDIYDAIGDAIPLLGIPTGVKMHSAVFAATSAAAGEAAAAFLRNPAHARLREAEIADLDEDDARAGRVSTRLHGRAHVPGAAAVLPAKASSQARALELEALCSVLARSLEPGIVHLFGPGTTTGRVLDALALEGTLLGVDAVRDGELLGSDLDEAALLELVRAEPEVRLILGVIGGQGSLLGRGNQQLSPSVLRAIGKQRLTVLASEDKLMALHPPVLHIDTGDEQLDHELSGYLRVHVAPRRTMIMRVTS